MAKKFTWRKPTTAEQAVAFKKIFLDLNFLRTVAQDHKRVLDVLDRVDSYLLSHSTGNGRKSEKEVEDNINSAYRKFIVQDEAAGKKPVKTKSVTV